MKQSCDLTESPTATGDLGFLRQLASPHPIEQADQPHDLLLVQHVQDAQPLAEGSETAIYSPPASESLQTSAKETPSAPH